MITKQDMSEKITCTVEIHYVFINDMQYYIDIEFTEPMSKITKELLLGKVWLELNKIERRKLCSVTCQQRDKDVRSLSFLEDQSEYSREDIQFIVQSGSDAIATVTK